ncbi:hypothetical protein [Mesorhizobium sp. WSM4315]|uniref:hypothetical protein n=1 Tax=Mesorhizobium sp. WSM4315 TaxID=2589882 RepID=UPI00163DCD7D|nr:hypothetical protein [Mesorhizobium sp. WSM4315]
MAARQLQRRKDYEQAEVDTALKTSAIAIGNANPDDHATFEAARQQGLDLIDKMGLDPGIRQQKVKDWFGTAAKARFDALIARDPKRALEMFGAGAPGESSSKPSDDHLGKKTPDEEKAFGGNAPAPGRLADLSPDDVQQLIAHAHVATTAQLIEARTNIALASQNALGAIAKTGSYSGNMPGPADFAGVYGTQEGGKHYRDFARKIDVGRQAFDMRTMPNQAIHAALRDAEPGPGSSKEEQAGYQVTAAAAVKTLSMRRADPAGYVREVFPNVDAAWKAAASPDKKSGTSDPASYKWAVAVSVAAQRQLGIETPQPLPRAVVESLADKFGNNNVPRAQKDITLRDLLGATLDLGVRETLFRQLDQAGLSAPTQVDPIITTATGRLPSAPPGEPQSVSRICAIPLGASLSNCRLPPARERLPTGA